MKKLVTQQSVSAAAEALVEAGLEPSITAVQARTGGSYTTVKPYLEAWEAERKRKDAIAPQVPVGLLNRGRDVVIEIYAAASERAKAEAALERDEACQERDRALATVKTAEAEVQRLEQLERSQAERIEEQGALIRQQELQQASLEASALAAKEQLDRVLADLAAVRGTLADRERELAELRATNQPALVEQLQAMQRQLDGMTKPSTVAADGASTGRQGKAR